MVLARWQTTVQDDEGNILENAQVTVRREITGSPLASLFSDRAGLTPIGNPVSSDADGYVGFHVAGGAYRITATHGAFSRTWRYVAVGLAAETDNLAAGIGFTFDDGVNDEDPGAGDFRFNNSTPGLATQIFISDTQVDGLDVSTWIASWDDGGDTANRGNLVMQAGDGSALMIARVTGVLTDAVGYTKVVISPITAVGTFTAGVRFNLIFSSNGVNGQGNLNGPGSPAVTAGELAAFTDANNLQGTGETITTVGAGKHSEWIPAGAMTPRITNGAGIGTYDGGSNDVTIPTLDFDQTTGEFAQFHIALPKGWDNGTVTFQPFWTATAGTAAQTVRWTLAAAIYRDDSSLNIAMGTAQNSDDALIAANDLHVGPESSAITIGNVPSSTQGLVVFQVGRDVANDNLAADARLIGIRLNYTRTVNTDD